ncbi:MAG: hypothetical protein FWC89_04865 [Defluviitaleaceae bacterium]|nr:hypothetical protein [Defluviitaleaceae bacterium]
MSYYPIKCPYCLEELSNQDVRFNLRTGIAGKRREIREETPVAPVANTSTVSSDGWLEDNAPAAEVDGTPLPDISWLTDDQDSSTQGGWLDNIDTPRVSARNQQINAPTEGYYTYSELKRYFGDENVKPLLDKEVHAPPALANKPEYKDDLLIGVEITTRKDGYETTTTYRRRYCECEKELMNAAGMKASYVLLMLGPSSSGKTMYLIALHKALKIDGGYLLPPEGGGSRGIAKLLVTVLSGGGEGDTSLKKMSDDLFDEGKLPFSTFSFGNEPLVLDISVDFKGGKSNNALLFLRDMPGEYLTNPDKTEELYKIASQFPLFDAFIMMLDPFTFTNRNVFRSDGDSENMDKVKLKYIDDLDEVLTGKVVPLMASGKKINQPTAVVVTKGDHFFNTQNVQRLEQKGVERSFPTLSSWQQASFDKQYFHEIDRDVERILQNLSPNVIKMLEKNFGNTFCGLVSALSKIPIDITYEQDGELGPGSYVTTPAAIKPWRVADPFIRMLMRLNIVPPFDEVEIRTPDMETRDAALGRNTKYLAAVNAWGRTFCNAWDEIAGEAITMQETRQKPAKKGLFGRWRT